MKAEAKKKAAKKKTTKKKVTKKKKKVPTPTELYDAFMEAVQKVEDAKTAKTRKKWMVSAEKSYKALIKKEDDLSSAKLRRAQRTKKFLDELTTE